MTQSTRKRLEKLIRYYRQNVFDIDMGEIHHAQLLRAKGLLTGIWNEEYLENKRIRMNKMLESCGY